MNIRQKFFLLAALASLPFAPIALAATETPKPDTGKTAATAAKPDEKIVKLTAKQRLPKSVKNVTIIDREVGDKEGEAVGPNSAVLVQYTGWLYDPKKKDGKGEQFDSSLKKQIPYGFFVGTGKVIKGWDLGVVGMKIKGKRTLIIPPALAYRDVARPNIPANSTLMFDIELIDILGKRDTPSSTSVTKGAEVPAAPAAPPPLPTITRLTPKDSLPSAPTTITAIDESVGEGPAAETGSDVRVHYTGWLYDASQPGGKGKQFDSSRTRNQLFPFKLGAGRVIRGWDAGVVGMKVKGKRTLIIPPDYGYGVRGAGQGLIPPNSTLIFDVELFEIPPPLAPAPATPAPG